MGCWTQRMLYFVATLCISPETTGGVLHASEPTRATQNQDPFQTESSSRSGASVVHLPYAQFQIPFSIDHSGTQPASVQLYVSTDGGATWQLHGRQAPNARHFEFRAAAEGEYLFTVHTVDASGAAFPSPNAPLRVLVDTTKPLASIQAELDHNGNLVVDLSTLDPNLDTQSATLRVRTDRESAWREVAIEQLYPVGDHFEGQVELILPACREVLMIFTVTDLAKNSSEASFRYAMPRTAVGQSDMQLASGPPGVNNPSLEDLKSNPSHSSPSEDSLPGAVVWDTETEQKIAVNSKQLSTTSPTQPSLSTDQNSKTSGAFPTSPLQTSSVKSANESISGPGRLAGNRFDLNLQPGPNLELLNQQGSIEELPMPQQVGSSSAEGNAKLESDEGKSSQPAGPSASAANTASSEPNRPASDLELQSELAELNEPYYCKSRTFSLDYSVEAMGGSLLSEVELWGTEDSGATWQKWGTDPDRNSPFDVRVGNDGLFGFRMVLVGQGGYVLGQPKSGEQADVWIHVDTEIPACKITRAVYGEGSEAGMLVIDYTCQDSQLADNPIVLSYSSNPDGPWTNFASGLKNSGLYLWKVEPNVPNRVLLKLEAIDKAGNTGQHRMDLPIDIKGLSPRGRIQGFRPIFENSTATP